MRNQGNSGYQERIEKFKTLKRSLKKHKQQLAETITNEMGKTIRESMGEVDKCIGLIDYYNKHSVEFLKDDKLDTRYKEGYVVNQPWGPTLSKNKSLYS